MAEATELLDLAREEDRLLRQVRSLKGTMEAKTAELEALGVFSAYAAIHRRYVELAEDGSLEALKRALFLQWFGVVEPPFLTGISDLDRESVRRTGALVEGLCASKTVDDELGWMLPYYFRIADWAFPPPEECPHLSTYCETNKPQGLVQPQPGAQLEGRGQMGDYWQSMVRESVEL